MTSEAVFELREHDGKVHMKCPEHLEFDQRMGGHEQYGLNLTLDWPKGNRFESFQDIPKTVFKQKIWKHFG